MSRYREFLKIVVPILNKDGVRICSIGTLFLLCWFQQTSFLGCVYSSNGSFRPFQGPGLERISGLLVDSLTMLA